MSSPTHLHYTRDHEWIDDEGRVGITDFAQAALGDVVYVELPAPGRRLTAGEPFAAIESVKSVSDLYCPVDGEVVAVNNALTGQPELVNQDPFGAGWVVQVQVSGGREHLLDAAAYDQLTKD